MTGPLITSFLLGKVSPITTSTTCNHCAGHATDASKTRSYSESLGETRSSSKWLRAYKPSRIRNLMAYLYYLKRLWHSHGKYAVRDCVAKIK
jgi:hypothetical protein